MRTNQNEPVSPPIDEAEAGCSSGEDYLPCSLLKTDYPNGNSRLMTEEEKKTCSVFLPQLLGEVLAALNSTLMKLQAKEKSQVNLLKRAANPLKALPGPTVRELRLRIEAAKAEVAAGCSDDEVATNAPTAQLPAAVARATLFPWILTDPKAAM